MVFRTSINCVNWSQTATEGDPIFGIKSLTALAKYMPDFIGGIAIDRMHCINGGAIKKISTLLFDIQYRNEVFSFFHLL